MICHNFDKRQNLHCKIRFFFFIGPVTKETRRSFLYRFFNVRSNASATFALRRRTKAFQFPTLICIQVWRPSGKTFQFFFSLPFYSNIHKKLVVFLLHFRISSLYFFVRLSLLSQVKSKKFHLAKSSNIVDSVL